ncbi:MAG: XdhC family protein, partial [Desulfobacterales bacterium]|nr:XdhC family protein [Desulfobacterales bacterium]
MTTVAETGFDWLSQGENLVLAKIAGRQGSTPRAAGTQMVVTRGGRIAGTIGGGLLEAKVMAQCEELLTAGTGRWLRFDLSYTEVAGSDMICGGGLEVLLLPIAATSDNIALFDRWHHMEVSGEEGLLIYAVQRTGEVIEQFHYALAETDERLLGRLPLSAAALEAAIRSGRASAVMQTLHLEGYDLFVEPIRKPKTLFLLGAGHVALPTAHMAALVGFRVVVLDDREAFANAERFSEAHAVRVLTDFEHPFEGLNVDRDSFIVIVTRGHLHDKTALAQALKTEAAYIGMIGSRRKRDQIFHRLRAEGFSEADLQRVHSPIGLDIGAETPEEIAVSIVAEMIEKKRSVKLKAGS